MSSASDPAKSSTSPISNADFFTPDYLQRRRQAVAKNTGFVGVDATDPKCPSGHAYGIRKSTWLTSSFREVHRKDAMDITPQDVIDVLNEAGVNDWVLMGLHGYVGYLPQPRGQRRTSTC